MSSCPRAGAASPWEPCPCVPVVVVLAALLLSEHPQEGGVCVPRRQPPAVPVPPDVAGISLLVAACPAQPLLSLGLLHPGVLPAPQRGFGMDLGTRAGSGWCHLSAPSAPQAWCSPTSLPAGSTASTSTRPSERAGSRAPSSPPSASSSRPGARVWTGATRAGWPTAPCTTPSACPANPAEGCTLPRASAATAPATGTCTASTSSASPPRSEVGAGHGAGGLGRGHGPAGEIWSPAGGIPHPPCPLGCGARSPAGMLRAMLGTGGLPP